MDKRLARLALIAAWVGSGAVAAADEQPATEGPIEKIVVIGTQTKLESARAEIRLTPGGVDLIDMTDWRQRNVSSLADVLRYVPGLWSTSDSGNDDIFLSSRGSNLDATDYDMNGVKLMQDGLPVTTADGNNHNRVIDPLSARHATVARGANAMKYGASTLGGAINFVSVTAHDLPGITAAFNAGSHGQRLGRITAAGVLNERADALLTVESKRWDGYRDHNEQERLGLYGNVGWRFSDAVATRLYGTWLENDQELPGALTRAQMNADSGLANAAARSGNYQLNVDTWRLASKTSWQIDRHRHLSFGVSIEEESLFHPIVDRVLVDPDGSGPVAPREVFSLLVDTDQRNTGVMLRYQQRSGDHDLLFGMNYGRTAVDGGNYRNLGGSRNGLSSQIDNGATLLEAFAMDRWHISNRTTLVFAAQTVAAMRDVRTTEADSGTVANPHDRYASVNPRLGAIYNLTESAAIYANVSRLFEPPTNYELEDNVAGGDAALDAMEGTVIEIGTRGSAALAGNDTWGWDLSLYYAAIDNEILSVEDPAAPGTSLTTNIDATVHAGIEAQLRATFELGHSGGHSLEPLVSVTVNDFSFDADRVYGNNRLPAAPDYAVRGEIVYRNGRGFHFGPTVEFIGHRYADFANRYDIGAYSLLGLRGGWSDGVWAVFAEVSNLLDENYVADHSVRNSAAATDAILNPGEPLSAYVGIRRRFF